MLHPNRLLADRYRILEFLGRGGMAEVYRAFDTVRRIHVAIKVLREDLAEDKVFLKRFEGEAEAIRELSHPSIVRFYDFCRDGHLAFLVMEFIDGITLRRRILEQNGPLSPHEVVDILVSVSAVLDYAHAMDYVHRDIKPGNIMIDRSGRVVVTDFGIARLIEGGTSTYTRPGAPAYMSPEQCLGHDVDGRSDIYSLGVTLFEMLTGGERPFTGETSSTGGATGEKIIYQHLHEEPPPPSRLNHALSPQVDAVVLRALAKDRSQRYATASEMLDAARRALNVPYGSETMTPDARFKGEETVVGGMGEQPADRGGSPPEPRPWPKILALVGALGIVLFLSLRQNGNGNGPEQTPTPGPTYTPAMPTVIPTIPSVTGPTHTPTMPTATPTITSVTGPTHTPTATSTPAPVRPSIALEPYYREIEGTDIPSIFELAGSEGYPSTPDTRIYRVDADPEKAVRIVIGWCAKDRKTLADNLSAMERSLIIDDREFDLGDLVEYDYDKSGMSCKGVEGIVREWPLGEHEIRSVASITRTLDDGWHAYSPGEYVLVYHVKIRESPAPPPPLPTQPECARFTADRIEIKAGECTHLRWALDGIRAVFLDMNGVAGHGAQMVCPRQDTTYTLTVKRRDGTEVSCQKTIKVSGTAQEAFFALENLGCKSHNLRLGQVKGQVFDRSGRIIVGAYIEVLIEGQANVLPPARSNEQGWYEFNVTPNQRVTFYRMRYQNKYVKLIPENLTVMSRSGCYQHINLKEK